MMHKTDRSEATMPRPALVRRDAPRLSTDSLAFTGGALSQAFASRRSCAGIGGMDKPRRARVTGGNR
jgi:hypothetical protein